MKKDVLFINPSNQKKTYQNLSTEYTAIATPAWTCLLANFVRNNGHDVAIFDVNIHGWDEKSAEEILNQYCPSLIVVMVYGHQPSASTQTMPAALRIIKDIKDFNKDVLLTIGGTHPSALPEYTLNECSADYLIQGEGTYTIEGLVNHIKGKTRKKDIPGLYYRDKNHGIFFTKPAPLISNLDNELTTYAWDLLTDMNNYRAHNMHCFQYFEKSKKDDFSDFRSPYVALNTSLGCPYSCHYCCINAIFGKPGIRYWSIDTVISWIDVLVNKYNIRNIRFDDELFIFSPKRVELFCDMVIEHGYDLNIWVYGRVDTINASILKKLKKAGITWICLGIESGNSNVRNNVNKNINAEISNVVKMIQSNDIYVLGNYMFGLPEDDMTTMQQTLDLAVDINCEFSNFYSVMAYPGSKLYESAKEKGIFVPTDWNAFSQHGYETYPLPTNYLSSADVLKFRDEAFIKYHANPKYLSMIENKFGTKTRKHIEKMLEFKIKRKILEN